MSTLYLLGGSPRSGKTTILKKVLKRKPIMAVSSDSLRESMRNVLIDESYVAMDKITFSGHVDFRRPGNKKIHQKDFQSNVSEEELNWKAIKGMIGFYDRKDRDLLIEGITITPELVQTLQLKNLKLKAVFVGFTEKSYLEIILSHAKKEKDWVYKLIYEEREGDETEFRRWFKDELEKNKKIADLAKKYGYNFFSVNDGSFEDYTDRVVEYLLQ